MNDHAGCHCIPCRARDAGVGPPPWGPAEWALINPAPDPGVDDPVKSDPAVVAAEHQRDAAREVFDLADEMWLKVTQEQATAEIRGHVGGNHSYVSTPDGLGRLKTPAEMSREIELKEAVAEAAERRDRAWQQVVKANAAIAAAQHAARGRLALAEARGR